MADNYIQATIELDDSIRPFIFTAENGKRFLTFNVAPRKDGPDQYGKTHNVSIRYKAVDGRYYTKYIGKGVEKVFAPQGGQQLPPPPAPQMPASPQPSAPQQAAPAAPQGYQPPYGQMMPPTQVVEKRVAGAPQAQPAPTDPTDDLPFNQRPELSR